MPDNRLRVDGARVLADLNTLRGIGAYKPGVHTRTFSEPHMRSLEWLAQRLPEAGLAAEIDGIGNVLGTSTKSGPKLLAGSPLESQNYAGWLDGPLGVVYALEAARVINSDPSVKGAVEVAAWCDEEGHFGHFLGSRSYVGGVTDADIDAARNRSTGRAIRDAFTPLALPPPPPSPPSARHPDGPRAASPSCPVRGTSSGDVQKCCFRCATTRRLSATAGRFCCRAWPRRPPSKAAAGLRGTVFDPAPPP